MGWSLVHIHLGRKKRRDRKSEKNVQQEEQRVAFFLGLVSFGAALFFPARFWSTQVLTKDSLISTTSGAIESHNLSLADTFDHFGFLPLPFLLAIFFAVVTIFFKLWALYPHRHFVNNDAANLWRWLLAAVGVVLGVGLGGFYAHFFVSMGKILGDPWGRRVYHSGSKGSVPMIVYIIILMGPALVHLAHITSHARRDVKEDTDSLSCSD